MSHPKIAKTDHEVLAVIRERWSPRAYDLSRPVSRDALQQVFEAARWAPSSMDEQPWQFIVADRFTNPEAFAAVLSAATSSNQSWAQYAPVLVLAAAKTDHTRLAQPNPFAWYDTAQAVMLLTLQATSMGLGLRQMAGFDRERARIACHVEPPYEPVVLMALGYPGSPEQLPNERHRTAETQPRSRRPIKEFVRWMAALAALATLGGSPKTVAAETPAAPAQYGYTIVHTYPHDPAAFTQGLIFRDGVFYESTGQYGSSSLRKVEVTTGKVLQQVPVDRKYFAEGLTEFNGRLLQLTWRDGLGFVYDRATLGFKETFRYYGEGWGLTHDGKRLILSDGQATGTLRFLDPVTFVPIGQVVVTDQGLPVVNLNELEFVKGEVFANVWHSNRIARINPSTGEVVGWIDLTGLMKPSDVTNVDAVLNGIAWDAAGDRLFVTGKLWPKMFEIRLVKK